jgi:hypothetical protein
MENGTPMMLHPVPKMIRPLTALMFLILLAGRLMAEPAGPTLHFDYGAGKPLDNPLSSFMYFVPLICPETVAALSNPGNTQCARVLSSTCRTNGTSFQATCEFEFTGKGLERNVFDHDVAIRRHDSDLKAGKPLPHQIASINVEGSGRGDITIQGTFSNGVRTVTEMSMRFNSYGHISPVNISLVDIRYRDGSMHFENETIARVNDLKFLRKSGAPKMEVTLDSVKRKDAGDGFWQNFLGGIKGVTANMFLPPLNVTPDGYQAMMNFGLALAAQQRVFTFPFATRLKTAPAP